MNEQEKQRHLDKKSEQEADQREDALQICREEAQLLTAQEATARGISAGTDEYEELFKSILSDLLEQRRRKMMSQKRLIGTVDVDTGYIWISDPTNLFGSSRGVDSAAKRYIGDWPDYHERMNQAKFPDYYTFNGVGIVVHAGRHGDGSYPIYADIDEDGTVRSVTVHFMGDDEEDDE